jgi:L-threonylcarbamoyladenylate synthase
MAVYRTVEDKNIISEAAHYINKGDIIVLPTETVYGLGGDAYNDKAANKIFIAKGRPPQNPLIVHVHSIEQAQEFAEFNNLALDLARHFWPGPLTLILPLKYKEGGKNPLAPTVCAGLETVAVRLPHHDILRKIIQKAGTPIAAPSANISGCISPSNINHCQGLNEHVALMLDGGPCPYGVESTIIDARIDTKNIHLLRLGALSPDDIIAKMQGEYKVTLPLIGGHDNHDGNSTEKKMMQKTGDGDARIISPGQLLKHYAPKTPLYMNVTQPEKDDVHISFGMKGAKGYINLSDAGDLVEAARNLFAALHICDTAPINKKRITVCPIPEKGLGLTINDRLKRASNGHHHPDK